MSGRAIQISVTHSVMGIVIGASIEALLPKFTADASLTNLAFETLVQVGVNGAALGVAAGTLQNDDPTYGIPFSWALFEAQPELALRIGALAGVVREQVRKGVLQMGPRVVAV